MFHHIFIVAESLVKAKSFLAVFFAFASGFLLSLTPCFLPLVPVMLGMLGFSGEKNKKETLFYLLFFILGLSVVYTFLGMISGIMGVMFGKISEHYLTQIIVGNIFLFFALVLLGVFNIPFIDIRTKRKLSWGGAFLLGGAGALSAGGCTFPVLGSILVLAALQRDFVFSGILLFSFSLGVSAMFFIVALGADSILRHKRGVYSEKAKKILAVLLLAAAEYFLFRGGALR